MRLRRMVVLDPLLEENRYSLLGRLPPRRDAADGRLAAEIGELLRRCVELEKFPRFERRLTLKVWSRTSFCCLRVIAIGFS